MFLLFPGPSVGLLIPLNVALKGLNRMIGELILGLIWAYVGMVIMVTCAAGIGVNYFEDCNSLALRNIADWAINKWWI